MYILPFGQSPEVRFSRYLANREKQRTMAPDRASMTKWTLLLVSSLTIMSIITISPVLPQMTKAFSDQPHAAFLVRLILTIPALFIAATAPIAGKLIDRFGRLKLLTGALLLYTVAGSAGIYLQNIYAFLVARALLGVAVGISMTIVVTLVADYYSGAERQRFVGIQIAFMSIGGILFLTLSGFLADVGWRYPFLLYLLALVILPLTWRFLYEPEAIKTIRQGPSRQVKAPAFIFILFVNTLLMWIAFFLVPVQIPFHLVSLGVGRNALIGMALATSTASSAISSYWYHRIKGQRSFSSVYFIGYGLMGIGFTCLALTATYPLAVLSLFFIGMGIGAMMPNTNMWVMLLAPPEIRGQEIGKLTMFWFLGQFLSPFVAQPLIRPFGISGIFGLAGLLLFLLALLFLSLHFLPKVRQFDH